MDTAVFSDEFDDTAKFRNQWLVSNGYTGAPECTYDSNVHLLPDPDSYDGHALEIVYRSDTCQCQPLEQVDCSNTLSGTPLTRPGSTGIIRSCPFPYKSASRHDGLAYAHVPYGKYEVREKIPKIIHGSSDWGAGTMNLEYNMNERYGGFDALEAGRTEAACTALSSYLGRHDRRLLATLGVRSR